MATLARPPMLRGRPPTIVVLAKYPTPGRVKTRLAAVVGRVAACQVYRAFILDLARRLEGRRFRVWWAFAPAAAPFTSLVRTRRRFPQRGADLGARIHHALVRVARRAPAGVLAIGADTPHVSLRELGRAARALAGGTDVVLGPARDGGYYLVGVRRPLRALFAAIPWSTPRVLDETRRRCRALGLSVVELAPSFDVDDAGDLQALARLVARRPAEFPATRGVLRRLGLNAPGGLPRPAASPSSGCGRR
ncbi:MAG: TIGR04282 family arsenosugar biosynthesis glycosyltransferase [Candidatus Binatia bacterium]